MSEKVEKIISTITNNGLAIVGVLWICLIVVFCILITINHSWGILFNYRESDYQKLEEEAERMIVNHTFETEYHLNITKYDNQSNSVAIKLYTNEDESISLMDAMIIKLLDDGPCIRVNVKNYEESSEGYTIVRNVENKAQQIFAGIALLILLPFVCAFLLSLIIVCIFIVIFFITLTIKKLSGKSLKRKTA